METSSKIKAKIDDSMFINFEWQCNTRFVPKYYNDLLKYKDSAYFTESYGLMKVGRKYFNVDFGSDAVKYGNKTLTLYRQDGTYKTVYTTTGYDWGISGLENISDEFVKVRFVVNVS